MGGGGGGGDSTSTSEPWSGQQPYLTKLFSEASNLYDTSGFAGDYYPDSTVASPSDVTNAAQQKVIDRATNGSEIINTATNSVNSLLGDTTQSGNTGLNTLNEMSQNGNQYLTSVFNQLADAQAQSINSQFAQAGRTGSGAQAAAIADAETNLGSQLGYNAFTQQVQAASNAANAWNTGVSNLNSLASTGQNLGNQAYTDAEQLATVGTAQDEYNQSVLDADVDKYNYEQQQAAQNLQGYANMVGGGSYGGTTVTTSSGSK